MATNLAMNTSFVEVAFLHERDCQFVVGFHHVVDDGFKFVAKADVWGY